MVNRLLERRRDEEGFTLIELMVVVLIMGILMAIAIPTFLSTQGSANDSSAKSNATNVFTGEKAYFEDNQVFIDASTGTSGSNLDANLPWGTFGGASAVGTVTAMVAASNASPFNEVAAAGDTGKTLLVDAYSKSGNCFYIYDDETTASAPVIAYAESKIACSATPALPTAVGSGNAGANIAAGAPAAGDWFASW